MVKYLRICVLAAGVLLAACATVPPEVVDVPRPPEPEQPRPVEPAREAPLRVGLVLSSTGSPVLQEYARLVLDGARLGAEQASTARRDVELVVRDDGGTTAGAERAIRELEQQGVRVVVGPLLDEAFIAAARARTSEGTAVFSPTAIAQPVTDRNVYALNVVDTRGATALGEYARRYTRAGVLYPRTPEETRQARAFMEAYSRGGHGSLTDAGFDPGSTNVSDQLTRLAADRVQVLFFPAGERHLQIVVPQIEFFGLAGVQLMGTESWLSDALRGPAQRAMEGAIIATPLWRESADLAWRDFVALYEARHRRSLESPIPALGYDAVLLAVRATAGATGEYRGATGIMTVQPDGITRRPFLVRMQSGRLVPVN